MTRNPRRTPSRRSRRSLFRARTHVAVVRSGSALAILDLERGVLPAPTPEAGDAWAFLIEGPRTQGHVQLDQKEVPGVEESRAVLTRVADYLTEQRLIEPRKGKAEVGEVTRGT